VRFERRSQHHDQGEHEPAGAESTNIRRRSPSASEALSRRRLLRQSGVAVASAGLGLAGCTEERRVALPERRRTDDTTDVHCAVTFFNSHEARTVEALTARIIPGTPDDPGAREAGVVNYLDCLLGTAQGIAEPMYRQAPFPAPEDEDLAALEDAYADLPPVVQGGEPEAPEVVDDTGASVVAMRDNSIESSSYGVIPIPKNQFDRYGYQSLLPPAEIFRRGLTALDAHSRARYGAPFLELSEEDQDAVMGELAEDDSDDFDVPSAEGFFELARRYTIEGMFSDPIYGGNRDLCGWRLIGYPGAQRAYTPRDVRDPDFRRQPQGLSELHRFNPGHAERDEPVLPVAGDDHEFHGGRADGG
jgi:gluconate 2-dehydrogenase gamma chain